MFYLMISINVYLLITDFFLWLRYTKTLRILSRHIDSVLQYIFQCAAESLDKGAWSLDQEV